MKNITDFELPSSDGIHQLRIRKWENDRPARGIVQIVHGVAEHIERYDDFAYFLLSQDFIVVGDDHLGHGKSILNESELGWFGEKEGWKYLVEDEKRVHDFLKSQYPDLPLFILGHSMGSFIVRTLIGWYPDLYEGCILSGTGHQTFWICLGGKVVARGVIAFKGSKYKSPLLDKIAFGGYLKRIEDPVYSHDWICSNPQVLDTYEKDPLSGSQNTVGLLYEMLEGFSIIRKPSHISLINKNLPVLFIAGKEDPVGNYGKGVKLVASRFKKAGVKSIQIQLYNQMRHEVLNETDREIVYRDILDWLENLL